MEDVEEIFKNTKERSNKSVDSLQRDLSSVRTGRASTNLVENLNVEYYGNSTPLNQLSSISVPEARTIVIQPWDKESLQEIEKSIMKSDLGLTPNSDGAIIRINVPELTEERRREMVKLVGNLVEEGHVAIRNIRRDSLEKIRTLDKDKEISQDDGRRAQQELQNVTDSFITEMDSIKSQKEKEVMEV
jgi:ribosome recycling factor